MARLLELAVRPAGRDGDLIPVFRRDENRRSQYDHVARVQHGARAMAFAGGPGHGGVMPLASSYSYPLLGAFWTVFYIFLWVIWFWITTLQPGSQRTGDPAGAAASPVAQARRSDY